VALLSAASAEAASPKAEDALRLMPTQDDVDIDRPGADEASQCKISARKMSGRVGWVVESPDGMVLRQFVDTNGDNVVDQWSYYKDGLGCTGTSTAISTARPTSIVGSTRPAAGGASTRTRTVNSTPGRPSPPRS
jgi:hypothetical protein